MTYVYIIILLLLVFSQYKKISFNKQILLALSLSVLTGIICNLCEFNHSGLLSFIADAYVNLLKMLVIPLVFCAIIHAVTTLRHHQGSYIVKVVIKSAVLLLLLTGISAFIGGCIGVIFNLGHGLTLENMNDYQAHSIDLMEVFLGIIPDNPIADMVNANIISVVVFAALIGFSSLKLHKEDADKAKSFIDFFHSAFSTIKKLASMIISLTPYGVFALITNLISSNGYETLSGMAMFILAMYAAMMIIVILQTTIVFIFGVNPITYYKAAWRTLVVAATTRSSFGTLPFTMDTLENKLKLAPSVSNFTPSIGATMGMSACAGIFPAMLVVMTLSILGQPISFETLLLISGINMIASLGVSGIPGTAYIAAGVTLSTLGLPFGIIAIAQSVDPIIDTLRTPVNVNSVMATAIVVDKTTGQ